MLAGAVATSQRLTWPSPGSPLSELDESLLHGWQVSTHTAPRAPPYLRTAFSSANWDRFNSGGNTDWCPRLLLALLELSGPAVVPFVGLLERVPE